MGRKLKRKRLNCRDLAEGAGSPDTQAKWAMWCETIDLNAGAKLGIDFCWCGESKMFVLFHKPISCKETPSPVRLLTRSRWLQL